MHTNEPDMCDWQKRYLLLVIALEDIAFGGHEVDLQEFVGRTKADL